MKNFSFLSLAFAALVLFTSCKKDDDNNGGGGGGTTSPIVAKWQWINYVDSIFWVSSNYGNTASNYSPSYTTNYTAGTFYDFNANGSFLLTSISSPSSNNNGTYTYTNNVLSLLYSGETTPIDLPVISISSSALKLSIGSANGILDTIDDVDATTGLPYDNSWDSVDTYNLTRTRNLIKS